MFNDYLASKGQFKVVAVVSDTYNFAECNYRIYKNENLVALADDLKHMMKIMVKEYDFELSEIEFAISELNKHENDTAHFGVFGTFLFTSDEHPGEGRLAL